MDLTVTDLFCGAGGSSLGAEIAGAELRLGLNHWPLAIETHSTNFPHGDHHCADISALTTRQIGRYPASDILMASPECTNHSLAKGAQRRKPQAASLFDDGPAGDDEQDRSRATMWDVVRFADTKLQQGRPYKAIIVENVPDAFKWGPNDDGNLFAAWRASVEALGYKSEIVWLNAMFCPPTPQSRDRMFVVFWLKGARKPDLKLEPPSWCPACEVVVPGQQAWKNPNGPRWGKYGAQYVYLCPSCNGTVLPAVAPAASAIDWSLPAQRIKDRERPLAEKTMQRIIRGLERVYNEPFAIRLLQSGNPRPLTLPLATLTARQDFGVVLPVAGNTFERTPGNRARNASLVPMDTLHATLDRAVVIPLEKHTEPRRAAEDPVHTVKANGNHHGFVVANYDPGWTRDARTEPIGTITAVDGHSLVIPYNRTGQAIPAEREPAPAATTHDRYAVLVPPKEPARPVHSFDPSEIGEARFRMFAIPEVAKTMQMHEHKNGDDYVVLGNKREQMRQLGNAVVPNCQTFLVGRIAEALDAA